MTKNLLVTPMFRGRRTGDEPLKREPVVSPIASPWMSSDLRTLLNTLKSGSVESQRTIAISGCSYSQIIQCRDWLPDEIGGVAWFSFDNPGCSPRIPIYAGTLELPASFEICGQKKYRTDAAIWKFRRTNRLSEVRWGRTRSFIEEGVKELEDKAFTETQAVEQRAMEILKANKGKEPETDLRGNPLPEEHRVYLTQYTHDFARIAMARWEEMGDLFFTMFARGF